MHPSTRPNETRRRGAIALTAALALSALGLLVAASSPDRLFRLAVAVVYPEPEASPTSPRAPVQIAIDTTEPTARVSPRFVSYAVDTSQVVGGHWWSREAEVQWPKGSAKTDPFDFDRRPLRRLTRALGPAYLRIGGTEADAVYYAEGDEPTPPGFDLRLSRDQWDAIADFARATHNELVFTLNAGPAVRDAEGRWRADNAERLIRRAAAEHVPVAVWELGNEVNAFWITHGLTGSVSPAQYGRDLAALHAVVRAHTPDARIAGPGVVTWPKLGEPPPRRLDAFTAEAARYLDVLTWHYYPQQSRRCPIATRRAGPESLLEPHVLDEVDRWAAYVEHARDGAAPHAEVWLGETGGAQCGGEPGVSDRHASSLWWLDQLGRLARRGQQVVVRQTLTGSHYGMLDAETLEPRPDYYASLLFKRLMGPRVLTASATPPHPFVRAYAHCTAAEGRAAQDGAVTLLLVHVGREQRAQVRLETPPGAATLYQVSADHPAASQVQLNGQPLAAHQVEGLLELGEPASLGRQLELPPLSYTFVVLEEAQAAACRPTQKGDSPREVAL